MKEIKEEKTIEITKYQTQDGSVFDNKNDAEQHEKHIVLKRKIDNIKSVYSDEDSLMRNEAYYIENVDDFMAIVEYLCLTDRFDKTDYQGKDWYFFYSEYTNYYVKCNVDKKYWIETLTEKKQEWEDYYKRFK